MTDSAQHLFDLAQSRLPERLRPLAERHWRAFREHLPRLPADDAATWLAALPRVFAASDFVAHACAQHPEVLQDLVASGDLLRAYPPGDVARRTARTLAGVPDEHALKARLRALRRREMVRIAIRDLAGWADLTEVLAMLSEFADACLEHALTHLEGWARERHGTPTGEASGRPVGFVVFALGKLGGRELNFSSDIDLMFGYAEEGETQGAKALSNHEFFVRLGQSLIGTLSEATADGFVFRVDMRLRPHGASAPLALAFDAIEQYYQTHGREWERYALIKMRAVAGDREAGAELLQRLKPFVFRKYLDYGAFEAMRAMKLLIEREVSRKGMQANVKLGPGGIREIEFIVQALQLIRGGREPPLQEPHLLTVLPRLAARGYVPEPDKEALATAYVFLRRLEHRLQMVGDAQTQALPDGEVERERLALACGHDGRASFEHELQRHRGAVQAQFARLFSVGATRPDETSDALAAAWLGTDTAAAERALRGAGYADAAAVLALLNGLREGPAYRAFSSEGRTRLDRLMPRVLTEAARATDPGVALARVVQVLEAIGRRSAYLALLSENPTALTQLTQLATASAWVAGWIGQHPVLLDELLDPRGLYELSDRAGLEAELAALLAALPEDDLEVQMERLREFKNAELLRVAAADIGPGLPPERVGSQLAALAEALLSQCLAIASRELTRRHGAPGGRAPSPGFVVIGYGKLGSLELGYASDLDMIFLYEEAEGAATTGDRPIPNELYFARLGQRLIHMVTARTPAGVLYEVDMRLRPSGKSGPLVTNLAAFRRYQLKDAWTWEHQALVRARAIAGSETLRAGFEAVRREVLCLPRDPAVLAREVREMRTRISEAHAKPHEGFDVKHDPGGIVDIEFMVQYWVLRWAHEHPDVTRHTDNIHILETLAGLGLIEAERARLLADTYRRCLSAEHRLKLMERGAYVPREELDGLVDQVAAVWGEIFE